MAKFLTATANGPHPGTSLVFFLNIDMIIGLKQLNDHIYEAIITPENYGFIANVLGIAAARIQSITVPKSELGGLIP